MTMGSSGDESEPGKPPANVPPIAKKRGRYAKAVPNLPDDINAPTQRLAYHRILVELMSYNDNKEYPSDKVFTAVLKPIHIYKWMCFKTFGTPDPATTENPQKRATTLGYWKKAISHFIKTTSKWDEAAQTGNPTQSKIINNLIKDVTKAEKDGKGAESQVVRAFTMSEFIQMLDLIDDDRYRAMMSFQFHLIGRCADVARAKKRFLLPSTEFEGFLTTKLTNCHTQVLLPSLDTKTCVYLSLAIWLEKWIQDGNGAQSQWLFCEGRTTENSPTDNQDNEVSTWMKFYSAAIKKAMENDAFHKKANGKVGSHSLQRLACTICKRNGVTKEDVEYRARSGRGMQDEHRDPTSRWRDVNAASKLCQSGACKYVIRSNTGLTDAWLSLNITPKISSSFGREVGAILAKPLIWACFDGSWSEKVSPVTRNRVFTALRRFGREPDEGNPVTRVEVIPSTAGGTVSLNEMILETENGDVEPAHVRDVTNDSAQWRAAVYARLGATQKSTAEIQMQLLQQFAEMTRRMKRLEDRMRTMISYAQARHTSPVATTRKRKRTETREVNPSRGRDSATTTRRGTEPTTRRGIEPSQGQDSAATTRTGTELSQGQDSAATKRRRTETRRVYLSDLRPATLSRNPKYLSVLWEEWTNGIDGALPAKEFNSTQRGRSKAVYSQRKVFWDCVERQIDAGTLASIAIAKIDRLYPGPVSAKLAALRKDERKGGHQQLNPFTVDPNQRGRRGQLLIQPK